MLYLGGRDPNADFDELEEDARQDGVMSPEDSDLAQLRYC